MTDTITLTPVDEPTILPDTDPILRQVSIPITEFNADLAQLVEHMGAIVINRGALGLAAVQLGLPVRVIVMLVEGNAGYMVNPVITRTLNTKAEASEGCLSVGEGRRRVMVWRPRKCDVEWQDIAGNAHSATFSGLTARVVQHEVDHLDGVLITDHGAAARNVG